MNLILEVSLLFVASLFLCKVILDIVNKKISTLSFLYLIFYIFYILPIFYTFLGGNIFYKLYKYSDSFYDQKTIIISIIVNFLIVLFFIFTYKTIKMNDIFNLNSRIIVFGSRSSLLLIILSLFIMVLLAPNPEIYLNYGAVIADYDPILKAYHANVAIVCRLLIFLAAINFLFIDKSKWSYVLYILLALVACWIGSKRSFVAYSLLIFLLSLFFSSNISPKKILPISISVLILFICYTNYYQNNVRDFDERSSQEKIENILIDYSRLQNERYVIFNLINKGDNLVPYMGASLLYNITFFVPRNIWNDKPYPYAVYYTSHYFNIKNIDDRLKWGFTTGLLDELIANFYWLGILMYLLVLRIFSAYNDKNINSFSGLVGIVVGCLMLILHFAAFSYIFVFWIAMNIYTKFRNRKVSLK